MCVRWMCVCVEVCVCVCAVISLFHSRFDDDIFGQYATPADAEKMVCSTVCFHS